MARRWKLNLIDRENPEWEDISFHWACEESLVARTHCWIPVTGTGIQQRRVYGAKTPLGLPAKVERHRRTIQLLSKFSNIPFQSLYLRSLPPVLISS
ncbi:hypothetical protein NXC12_CH03234 [Rhizobium etli]|uniref:Uncharacterized protein n=2 Tax=Rhizobium etli TaxID=29449 RepID=A0AAN1BHA3_RHIET|nr:hypothetical protein REMIM1_CH03167 [Rhizobium etli bv. mimosae str. Mim1]ARQ11220.1 hypothetical protein NXC12_CH03234 [Rhizobium etli]